MTAEEFLPKLPQIIADAMCERLPDLGECKPHPGRFDAAEVKRMSARAPAVRISLLGIKPAKAGNHAINLAAFIVTNDQRGLDRNDAALAIAASVVRRVRGTAWGNEVLIGEASEPTAQNLYSANADKSGFAIWAVNWTHEFRFGDTQPEPCVLKELYIGIAPKIGAAHEDDYIRIGTSDGVVGDE